MDRPIISCFERYEKKCFLTPAQYAAFVQQMAPYVQADAYPQYTLCNLYYDTDDYRLIRASIEKPVYKEKLRVRSYGVAAADDRVFVELKKKYAGVVYKRRITSSARAAQRLLRGVHPLDGEESQIQKEIAYFQQMYRTEPKVFIAYDRQAFQGIDDPELRVTFDRNMRYRLDRLDLAAGDDGAPILGTDHILMEIKIPGACPLWLCRLLTANGIYSTSFSKYGECYRTHILQKTRQITTKEMYLSA